MHILLIYKLTTEAQGIQANLKGTYVPKNRTKIKIFLDFFENFLKEKCVHMGTRGAREGGGWADFVPFGPVFYFAAVICTVRPVQVNSTHFLTCDIFHHCFSQFLAFFKNCSKRTK